MHNLTLHEYQIVCDIMFNNYYDAPVYRILEGLQDQTARKYYKNFDLLNVFRSYSLESLVNVNLRDRFESSDPSSVLGKCSFNTLNLF